MAILFMINIIIANLCLPSNFGIISLLIINAAIAILITGFGIDSIVMYSLTNKKWTFSQSVFFMIKALIVQLILFLSIEFCFFYFTGRTLLSGSTVDYLLIEILYFAGLSITEKYLILFYARNLAKQVNFILLIYSSSSLLFFLYLNKVHGITFKNIFTAVSVQSFLQGIILLIVFHIKFLRIHFERLPFYEVFKALKLSGLVLITNVIQFIAYRIDFLIISAYQSNYEVGIYAQANKFANLLWVLPGITVLMITPRIPSMEDRDIPSLFRVAFITNLAIAVCTCAASFLFYHFFLPPEFMAGINIFFILLPGYICWALVIYFGAYFSAKGLFRINLTGSSLCFSMIVLLDFILIPRYGLVGAAIASSISYIATFIYYITVFSRKTSNPVISLFAFKRSDIGFVKSVI